MLPTGAADVPNGIDEDEDPRACVVDDAELDEESGDSCACLVDNATDLDGESDA